MHYTDPSSANGRNGLGSTTSVRAMAALAVVEQTDVVVDVRAGSPLSTFKDEAEPPQAALPPSALALAGDAGSAFEDEGGGKSPPLKINSFEEEGGKKSPSSGGSKKKNRQQLKELKKSTSKKLAAKNSGKAGQDE